jgi:predicted nucleic acid-binding Zn ribbon protein
MAKKKKELSQREKRQLRTQQIIFITIAILLILAMVLALFVNT